jgi:AraC-like DNA-binding protein
VFRIVNPSTRIADAGWSVAGAMLHADRRRYEQIIEQYLSDCYARRTPARVGELADLLGGSRPYLSRLIPHLFGRPLGVILSERKLREAKRLLDVTTLGLDDIAAASAFGHRSTFFRQFQSAFGVTPAEYRAGRGVAQK